MWLDCADANMSHHESVYRVVVDSLRVQQLRSVRGRRDNTLPDVQVGPGEHHVWDIAFLPVCRDPEEQCSNRSTTIYAAGVAGGQGFALAFLWVQVQTGN